MPQGLGAKVKYAHGQAVSKPGAGVGRIKKGALDP